MRARTLAILAALGLAGTAPATERLVYRCKDAVNGHLSFQSQPCGRGQVQEATYDATPDKVLARPDADRESRSSSESASVRRGSGRGSRTTGPRSRAVAAVIGSGAKCKRERAARDKAYRTDFKMGYRERQRWGERVRKACK